MRAYVIDAEKRLVTEIDIDPEARLKGLQAAVGGYISVAHRFEETSDDVYVNDDGLAEEDPFFFHIVDGCHPFAGNGVVVGFDGIESSCDVHMPIEDLRKKVVFLGRGSEVPREVLLALVRE